MVDTLTKSKDSVDTTIQEPSKYKVIIFNDDQTPIEFVVEMLMKIFRHSESAALDITMKVHNDGYGVAGIYSYEIAEQKGVEATNLSRANGYPLVIKVEAE